MYDPLVLAQALIDFLAWFAIPFAFMISLEWAISFFRKG